MERGMSINKPIVAGDYYKVQSTLSDSPSTTWTATMYLTGLTPTSATGSARSDGGFDFVFSADKTSLLSPGTYGYYIRAEKGEEVYTRETGTIRVLANPANQVSTQEFAEKMVDLLEKALSNQLNADEAVALSSISIGGRSLAFLPREELIKERSYWIRKLNKKRKGNSPSVKSVPVDIDSLLGNRS